MGGPVILYGLATCGTCKAALKALEGAGRAVTFRDVRAEPLTEAEIAEFVAAFGPAIVNRRSTTWRGMSEFLRLAGPEAQIAARPTVMTRPVIRSEAGLTLGWDAAVQARLLG